MLVYPDTSIIVSAFTEEVASSLAEDWLRSATELAASLWCGTEVAAALAAKVRGGFITETQSRHLSALIGDLLDRSARSIPVTSQHFVEAGVLLSRSVKPLRASDALHLAIAADAGATLWTLDRPMAGAGQALGLDVRLLA